MTRGRSVPTFGLFSMRRQHAAAELTGIHAGDGTMYRTNSGVVIEIRGNPQESRYYSEYVRPLFELTTGIRSVSTIRDCLGGHMVGIRCCRKEAYTMLHKMFGFPIGDKCLLVRVPSVILKLRYLWADYVRGVFDTDGSVYLRSRERKTSTKGLTLDISSSSKVHVAQLNRMVRALGFNWWLEDSHVRMRGRSTVNRFFQVVQPHNVIHIKRLGRLNGLRAGVA